jgi:hypothetical protein
MLNRPIPPAPKESGQLMPSWRDIRIFRLDTRFEQVSVTYHPSGLSDHEIIALVRSYFYRFGLADLGRLSGRNLSDSADTILVTPLVACHRRLGLCTISIGVMISARCPDKSG